MNTSGKIANCFLATALTITFLAGFGCGDPEEEARQAAQQARQKAWAAVINERSAPPFQAFLAQYPDDPRCLNVRRQLWEITLEGKEREKKHIDDIYENGGKGRFVFTSVGAYKNERITSRMKPNPYMDRFVLFSDGEDGFYSSSEGYAGRLHVYSSLADLTKPRPPTPGLGFGLLTPVPSYLIDGAVSYLYESIPVNTVPGVWVKSTEAGPGPLTFMMVEGVGFVHVRGHGFAWNSSGQPIATLGDFLAE